MLAWTFIGTMTASWRRPTCSTRELFYGGHDESLASAPKTFPLNPEGLGQGFRQKPALRVQLLGFSEVRRSEANAKLRAYTNFLSPSDIKHAQELIADASMCG